MSRVPEVRRWRGRRLTGLACVAFSLAASLPMIGGCGGARPMRAFRPEVVGTSLGYGGDMPRSISQVEVGMKGVAGTGPAEATRRLLEEVVRRALSSRGYIIDGSRPGAAVLAQIDFDPGGVAVGGDDLNVGTPEDWASLGVAAATRVHRTAREEAEAKGAGRRPPTGPRVSLEVSIQGVSAWRGEVRGMAGEADPVLATEPALRTLVWHLPAFPMNPPSTDPLTEAGIVDFYRKRCESRSIISPALPYPVRFPELEAGYHRSTGGDVDWATSSTAHLVQRGELLPAYVRLLETTDRVFPTGGGSLKRPFDGTVWEKATLLGEYAVGDEVLTLVVEVADTPSGYVVKSCRVADFLETPELLEQHKAWEVAASRDR